MAQIRCKECSKLFKPSFKYRIYCSDKCVSNGVRKIRQRYFQSEKGKQTQKRYLAKLLEEK